MLKKSLALLGSIVLIFVIWAALFVQSRVPNKKGTLEFKDIPAPAHAYFDRFGIPHIESKSLESSYYALGYIMASERLFQMDLYRRLVQGRLSEIFGKKTLEADKLLRTLRLKETGLNMEKNLAPKSELYKNLSAYLKGVQSFIDKDELPIEFLILGYEPEPFEISDVIGVTGYMAMTFAEGLNGDIYLSELREKLPDSKIDILRRGDKTDSNYFGEQKVVKTKILDTLNKAYEDLFDIVPEFHGSNSWVLSGSRTESGFPILANDPHIGVSNPHVFYEAHIKSPKFELYGNYIPLIPFPVMGHTPHSAWGLTMSEVDDFNVYLEKIDPDNSDRIMFNQEWVELKTVSEQIKVKGAKDHYIDIKIGPHGPLLDGTSAGVKGKSLSISWSVHHPENNVLMSLYEIPRAKTVENFKQAASHAAAPGLNVSWVNKSGDIVWWAVGKYPKLPDGVDTDLVLRGWDGSHEIERYYEIVENPHKINPDNGVIITANYRPQYEEFSHFDGYWQPAGRYFRIEKLLERKEKWNLEELKKIQTDIKVPISDQMKDQLLKNVKRDGLSKIENETLEVLRDWDGVCDLKSVGCSIYHMWNYYNTFNAYTDEMGEKGFEKFGKTADFWHAYKSLMFNMRHPMWDKVKTQRVESGADILTQSLKESIRELQKRYGKLPKYWAWGKVHQATYIHPLGRVSPLDLIFNIGPIPAIGGRYAINNIGHKKSTNDFSVVHAPATRRLIDMKDTKNTLGVLPTGNSGNPFSTHFADQTKIYHEGKYRVQTMDWERIRMSDALIFKPL